MRILLADDDAAMREMVRRALEADGHEVAACADGTAAAEMLESAGRFDALIADVDMPGLDGISLCRRAAEQQADLRLILVSAHASELDRASGLIGPRLNCLTKPFTLDKIKATVAKL